MSKNQNVNKFSIEGILPALFYFEDMHGLFPKVFQDGCALAFNDEHYINELLESWYHKRSEYVNGEISSEEYRSWRVSLLG